MQAHDLLLEEDLPDRRQELHGDAVVLLVEGFLRRLPDEVRPLAARGFRDDEQAAPVVADSVEQLRRHGHGRKFCEVGGPAGNLAAAFNERRCCSR